MCDAKAATIYTVRAVDPDCMADTDAARTQKADCKKEGLMDMKRFFLHHLFIAGLKDELRSKIMGARNSTLQESLSLPVQVKKKATLSAITEKEDTLGEEDIDAINAIKFQRGQKPRKTPGRGLMRNVLPNLQPLSILCSQGTPPSSRSILWDSPLCMSRIVQQLKSIWREKKSMA